MARRFSHFVVVADHQTGKMWIDGDTTSVRFDDGAVWNETKREWECPKSGTKADKIDDELYSKLDKYLKFANKNP